MATLATSVFKGQHAPALIIPAESNPLTVSYEQLVALAATLQRQLARLGIKAQDAVSIALPNSLEFAVAFLAVSEQRAIAAPLNPAYKQEEFEFYIEDLHAALVLVPKDAVRLDSAVVRAARRCQAAIAEAYWDGARGQMMLDVQDRGRLIRSPAQLPATAQSNDIALVLHTSGTTGKPKAVPLTHRNLTQTMANIQRTYRLTPQDRTLLVMPLFHVHGLLAGLLAPLHSGGSVIVPPRFSASDFWHHFRTYGANWYTAVPTMHQILLKQPAPNPLPAIRFIRSCSAPLAPSVLHQLEQRLQAPVLEAYAMTEAAHQMTSNPLPPGKRAAGSVGLGQGVEVRILDEAGRALAAGREGEIGVRGPNLTAGYLHNAAANAAAFTPEGFFRTGDQGRQDPADGYLYITGRIKELINKGGEKISPVELDHVLAQHPAVAEAVSFAIPDDLYGQEIGVAIVRRDADADADRDRSSLDADQLKTWLAQRVAKFKIPKKVYFTPSMPKTATGKIQRRVVADAMLKQDEARPKARL
ncbi:MAG: hypothetical protein M1826_005793 [Phylliscum demangeonii]|nr:MAG: hypothetical protein M1826_005793 [Phylliscum demangeonii]